jgi:hypothetical protein
MSLNVRPREKLPARFCANSTGRKPVREWVLDLPEAHRRTVAKDMLGSDRIARVIFCMGDGHMILLHGFIKKTQKTPKPDIDLALKRMKEVT